MDMEMAPADSLLTDVKEREYQAKYVNHAPITVKTLTFVRKVKSEILRWQ